jgi:hypothetical protein
MESPHPQTHILMEEDNKSIHNMSDVVKGSREKQSKVRG